MSRPGLLRLSQFGLSSLFATMLLCISVAGWWRHERQIDAVGIAQSGGGP